MRKCHNVACENSRFSSLFAAEDVSRGISQASRNVVWDVTDHKVKSNYPSMPLLCSMDSRWP